MGARSAAKQIRPLDEVISFLDGVGLDYVGPYVGHNKPCPARCRNCGASVSPNLGNVIKRGNSCVECGHKTTAAKRRTPEEIALSEIRKAGFTPLGQYVNANTRLNVVHDACGRPASVHLTDVRLGKAGCKSCAMDMLAARRRVPNELAIAEFGEAGYELIGPYVDANTPIDARHVACGKSARPSLTEVRAYGGSCPNCGSERTAASRRLQLDDVRRQFEKSSLKLLGTYKNGVTAALVQCLLCDCETEIALQTIQSRSDGTVGCQTCSRTGVYTRRAFRNDPILAALPGIAYLIRFEDTDGTPFLKVGIGRTSSSRLRQHERRGGRVIQIVDAQLSECFEIEQMALRKFATFRYKPAPGRLDGGDRECFTSEAPIDLDALRSTLP